MLLFSTLLDIDGSLTRDRFIDVILEWNNTGSRAANVVQGIEWNDSFGVKFGSDSLWLQIDEYPKESIIAVRHEKIEADGVVWDTDYVMNFDEMKMSVRLDRSYREDALRVNAEFSTPHFISLLIRKGYLRDDINLPVLREPTVVDGSNGPALLRIVDDLENYALPLVYVSKAENDEYPLDVGLLASKLKGAAHVFVEGEGEPAVDEHDFRSICSGGGCIDVFFPSRRAEPLAIPILESEEGWPVMAKVLRPVVQYSNSKIISPLYTWEGVRSAMLLGKLDAQHEEMAQAIRDATDANELLEAFFADFHALEEEVRRLSSKNAVLEYENAALRGRGSGSLDALLIFGFEQDFFDGEVKDLVLSTLIAGLRGVHRDTRRHDVISDIVENNDYRGLCERRAEEMKKLLKESDPTSERFEQGLKKLGFETKNNRKHLKVKYYGDERYWITFPKTPSDVRSAANDSANAARKVF